MVVFPDHLANAKISVFFKEEKLSSVSIPVIRQGQASANSSKDAKCALN